MLYNVKSKAAVTVNLVHQIAAGVRRKRCDFQKNYFPILLEEENAGRAL
jgi:hypothetical protein